MIELQLFEETDIDRLISWVKSPEFLLQWAGPVFTYPLDRDQLMKHLEETKGKNPKRIIYKVVDTEAKKIVGHIEWNNIDRENHSATVSRVLAAPDARGKGIGTAMVNEMIRIGFEELNLHRIELRVFDFNRNAIKCYENAGFKKEGTFRDACRFGNEYWTVYQMSLLENEWEGKR